MLRGSKFLPILLSAAVHAGAAVALVGHFGAAAPPEAWPEVSLMVHEEISSEPLERFEPPPLPDPPPRTDPEFALSMEEIEVVYEMDLPDDLPTADSVPLGVGGTDRVVKVRSAPKVQEKPAQNAPPPKAAPTPPAHPAKLPVAPPAPRTSETSTPTRRGDRCVPPDYPTQARREGLEGRVVLRVHVTASGDVDDVEVAESSGHMILDAAAERAVRKWRFLPAMRDGGAVDAWVRLPFRFRLHA